MTLVDNMFMSSVGITIQSHIPRRNGYTPFSISVGAINGYSSRSSNRASVYQDLGPVMHSCWTYWGTSGAPLINLSDGTVSLFALFD